MLLPSNPFMENRKLDSERLKTHMKTFMYIELLDYYTYNYNNGKDYDIIMCFFSLEALDSIMDWIIDLFRMKSFSYS